MDWYLPEPKKMIYFNKKKEQNMSQEVFNPLVEPGSPEFRTQPSFSSDLDSHGEEDETLGSKQKLLSVLNRWYFP